MNEDRKSKRVGKLGALLGWVAVLYLAAWALDWLLRRKWDGVLILALVGAIGSTLIIAMGLGVIFEIAGNSGLSADENVVEGEWAAGAVVGLIWAGVNISGAGRTSKRKAVQRKRKNSPGLGGRAA